MTTQFKVLERNHPRVDAYDKVTGRAAYASDVYLPGMLACKLLPSARNHARIVRLDTSKAEAIPAFGVSSREPISRISGTARARCGIGTSCRATWSTSSANPSRRWPRTTKPQRRKPSS